MRHLCMAILLAVGLIGCSKAGIYSGGQADFGAVVEFPSLPPLAKGVIGYNVYMSETATGTFEKINDTPVSGRFVVPKRQRGKDYFFKMTAVTSSGAESPPSRVLVRKAGYLSDGAIKPSH